MRHISGPPDITLTGVAGDTVTLQHRDNTSTDASVNICHQQSRRKSSFALNEKIWELRVSKDRQKGIWLKQSWYTSNSSSVSITIAAVKFLQFFNLFTSIIHVLKTFLFYFNQKFVLFKETF